MINFKVQNQLEKIEQISQDMIIPIIDNNNLKGVSPDKFATSGGGTAPSVDLSGINSEINNIKQDITAVKQSIAAGGSGPWDVELNDKFINGNVTISGTAMWDINQAYTRIYTEVDLKQGDVITIPMQLRMYLGWKTADGTFGKADWLKSGKSYTVTVDGKYVILLDTGGGNGLRTTTIDSYGKVMVKTSNAKLLPKPESSSVKDHTRDDKIMRCIAHQGYHLKEHANSLKAFEAAGKEGWNYVETDIYKTSDNHWVVGHDKWMPEGYTNGTVTIAAGDHSYEYEKHTLAEIRAFHSADGTNKVDTLEEFCAVCKRWGLHPYIEIKSPLMGNVQTGVGDKYDNKSYMTKALDIIRRCGLGNNFSIISSGNWNLEETVKYDNTIRVGYINVFEMYNINTTDKNYWDKTVTNLNKIISKADGKPVNLFLDQNLSHIPTCPAENMDWLIDKRIPLEVWTANNTTDVTTLHSYITGVTADNVHVGEKIANL